MFPIYVNSDTRVRWDKLQDARDDSYVNDATVTVDVYQHRASDGVTVAASTALTSAIAAFTSADVGRKIVVAGAGANGGDLRTTIAAFVSATAVTLTAAASVAATGAVIYIGISGAETISMPYVSASDGRYQGIIPETAGVRLPPGDRLAIELTATRSGNTAFRRVAGIAQYKGEN